MAAHGRWECAGAMRSVAARFFLVDRRALYAPFVRPGIWPFSPMRTRRPAAEQLPADELFRSRLENQIDLRHPLVQLSHRLPWSALEQALSPQLPATTGTGGRPALPVRLIAGLLYLKHAYDLSDEAVCERWLEKSVLAVLHRRGGVPDLRAVRSQLPDPLATASGRSRDGSAVGAHDQHRSRDEGGGCARVVAGDRGYHRAGKKAIAHPTDSRLLEVARRSWCCWPSDTASHCDRAMRGKVRRCAARLGAMRMRASSSACARCCDANARSWHGYHAICSASWPSWNRRYVSASVSGWSARNGCWHSVPRTNKKTLRLARAGSGMHEQGARQAAPTNVASRSALR